MLRPNELSPLIDPVVHAFFDEQKALDSVVRLFPQRFRGMLREYSHTDPTYFPELISVLHEMQKFSPVTVFLDPDTGIEPSSGCSAKHLRLADLEAVCAEMTPSDRVIVYQHAPRNKATQWVEQCRTRVETMPWTGAFEISSFCEPKIAHDVCFLKFRRR